MRINRSMLRAAALFASLWLAAPASAQWTADKGVLLRGTIVTMDDQGTVKKGALFIRNGKIESILPEGAAPPAGAIVVDTKGYIFPGMINLHNHIAYNFLPLYPVPKKFTNRDQWPSGKEYEALVNNPKNLITDGSYYDLQTEALKYAEIKALVGGETTIQGSPTDAGTSTILVRNVEMKNFGEDHIGQSVLPISSMFVKDLPAQKASIEKLDGWLFHLSEGIDEHARNEYFNPKYDPSKNVGPSNQAGLKNIGLVTKNLIGIHCTGLKEEDFADWKKTTGEGAKVVWSPLSNLMLYGKTTDVLGAKKHGATIAIGTDWSPSGSKNMLWELKVVDQVNRQQLKKALSDQEIVAMATKNPAKLVKWTDKVGMIKPGMSADLLIVDDVRAENPYRNLILALENQVQLVMVDGDPIYGDESWLAKLKVYNGAKHYEVVKGTPSATRKKALDLKRPVPEGEESLEDIKKALVGAIDFNPTELAAKLNEGRGPEGPEHFKPRDTMKAWLVDKLTKDGKDVPASLKDPKAPITAEQVKLYESLKFPNERPLQALDPIYQQNDPTYFAALEKNIFFTGADKVFDVTKLRAYLRRRVPTAGVAPSVPQ